LLPQFTFFKKADECSNFQTHGLSLLRQTPATVQALFISPVITLETFTHLVQALEILENSIDITRRKASQPSEIF
jgi:hypothetical protein